MAQKKTVEIKERETRLVENILDGLSNLEAYKKVYINTYTDTKCKYEVNKILKKQCVIDYTEHLIVERESRVSVDEPYVIGIIKHIATHNKDKKPAVALNAAIALGKTMAMFADKQILDTTLGHREMADKVKEMRDALDRGETPEPLEEKDDKSRIIEFKIKDGTNDG